jgi:endonuclease VIII
MPEGPEVYSFGIEVHDFFYGKKLNQVKILSGKYKRSPFKNYKLLKKLLPLKVLFIRTQGKILLIELDNNYIIVVTFGMTGFFTPNHIKHNRIEFINKDNESIYYNDQRNFGNIYFLESSIVKDKLADLGPDILDHNMSFKIFKNRFNKYVDKYPNREIGLILLDQSFVCGIGNYLRADILYLSKISPFRKISTIDIREQKTIYKYSYNLLRYYTQIQINFDAYYTSKLNITRIKQNLSYRLKLKQQPKNFGRVFLIYGEKYDPFNNLVTRDKFYGRSIFWVKEVQK